MTVFFRDVDFAKSTDIGSFGRDGMDVSPMDIPLKGDVIKDGYGRLWEVVGRQHDWNGPTHYITLHLKRL